MDGTIVEYDMDTYDWDQHEEEVEQICEKLETDKKLSAREQSVLYIQ